MTSTIVEVMSGTTVLDVTGTVLGSTNEDATAASATFDLLTNASDVDGGTLSVPSTPVQTGGRSISFTFDGPNHTLSFDPNQFNDLAVGESEQVVAEPAGNTEREEQHPDLG